jgi:glycosyltransferase involved in cell wall biosynthesis
MGSVRVAYTLEQCWHGVPGGTAVAALEVARELSASAADIELVGVSGAHSNTPSPPWTPPIPTHQLRHHGAALYASWLFLSRPPVERATGRVDVVHATTIIPCPSTAPLVVTVHDLAFLHEPEHFTRWGRLLFRRSLAVIRERANVVLCSSQATMDDCAHHGLDEDRLRLVPLGVRLPTAPPSQHDIDRVVAAHSLAERYVLFVGTVEPRKNLRRLAEAVAIIRRTRPDVVLAVAGADGWGDGAPVPSEAVRFLGFVSEPDLGPLFAGASAVCYPSIREGFGLPVLEAMAYGAPVVTSRGTATEEAAGGAAVLVDPYDVEDIARGIDEALHPSRGDQLRSAGHLRAAAMGWDRTAEATAQVYRDICA